MPVELFMQCLAYRTHHLWSRVHQGACVIESVGSICRDSADTQYMAIQKSQKRLACSLYNNVPFIFECFHGQQDSQWCEKASQRYQTNNSQNGPNVFLSSFFRWASSILREPLTMVYPRNSSILYGAVYNPIAFSQS